MNEGRYVIGPVRVEVRVGGPLSDGGRMVPFTAWADYEIDSDAAGPMRNLHSLRVYSGHIDEEAEGDELYECLTPGVKQRIEQAIWEADRKGGRGE
jgi:hypothetical protein